MTPPIILNPGMGFACPWCHVSEQPYRFANRPGVLRCRACKKDVGLVVMGENRISMEVTCE